MADLNDSAASWEAGVYQIETTDPVIGGAPNPGTGAGMSNIPHLQLAKRTVWLKEQVEALVADLATLGISDISGLQAALDLKAPIASPALTGNPTAPTPAQFDDDTSIATTAFVQRALGNYHHAETVAAGFTVLPADAGKAYVCGLASGITITMPTIAATELGACFTFVNTGTADVTVQRAGSDTIDTGAAAVTSVVLPPNSAIMFIRVTGSSLWHTIQWLAQATQAEAEAGVATSRYMDPLRTAQAIAALTIGPGQTWQSVTGSRAHSTSYQNTTGRAIEVAISYDNANVQIQVSTNGSTWVTVISGSGGSATKCAVIVPKGHYYRLNGSVTIFSWSELS